MDLRLHNTRNSKLPLQQYIFDMPALNQPIKAIATSKAKAMPVIRAKLSVQLGCSYTECYRLTQGRVRWEKEV